MTRTPRVALTVLIAAFSITAGGCGEDENETFKQDYNTAVKPLSELNADIGDSLGDASGKSNVAIAKQFDQLAAKAQQTRENLSELDPPGDAKESFDELLGALEQGTENLRAVGKAAKEGDPSAAGKASQELVESGQEIQKAETALQNDVDG